MGIFDAESQDYSPEEGQEGGSDALTALGLEGPGQPDGTEDEMIPEPTEEELAQFGGDPEKYAKSYSELRRAYTQSRMELGQLKKQQDPLPPFIPPAPPITPFAGPVMPQAMPQIPPMMPQMPMVPPVNQGLDPISAAAMVAAGQVDARLAQWEATRQRQDQVNQEAMTVAQAFPDFGDLADDMIRLVDARPHLFANDPNPIQSAYWMVKAGRMAAASQGDPMRQAARMPGGQAAQRMGQEPTPEDLIKQAVFGAKGRKTGLFG